MDGVGWVLCGKVTKKMADHVEMCANWCNLLDIARLLKKEDICRQKIIIWL